MELVRSHISRSGALSLSAPLFVHFPSISFQPPCSQPSLTVISSVYFLLFAIPHPRQNLFFPAVCFTLQIFDLFHKAVSCAMHIGP
ncbi:hypothetical protein QQP08_003075 [Theobroma cacao]|nr:hypothetical protein QQP08_003075 [Theobroma cacao]